MTLSYDRESDVLYITFEAMAPEAYSFVENEYGDVLKIDKLSHRVIGCTITFFAKRARKGKIFIR
jgi:uncharacterized protein YuzE